MVTRTAAIENDFLNTFAQGGLRGDRPESLGADSVGGQFVPIRGRFAGSRGRGERYARDVIDELDVDILIGKADAHARALFSAAELLAHTPMSAEGQLLFLFDSHLVSEGAPQSVSRFQPPMNANERESFCESSKA